MRTTKSVLLLAALVILGGAESALAWGPAAHVGIGSNVLGQLGLLPAAIAAVLARNRLSFLYGGIAADVVFAKRLSRVKQFCHHWSTGFQLLGASRSDRDQAFAYGYLSHLAADTVAHGKFVPRQVMLSHSSVNFGHLYWELRADGLQSAASWSALDNLLQRDHTHHHVHLASQIHGTLLPYRLNRICFNRMNAVAMNPGFRSAVSLCARLSRAPLSSALLEGYHGESVDRVLDVLTNGPRSAVLRDDPNGTSALMQLKVQRRHLRRLRTWGSRTDLHLNESSATWTPSVTTRDWLSGGPDDPRVG